ncbi:protease inhibitor I42 family protein [Syntrophomonas palmitatica]|uniref:protease inhibitor I42 family protein n=1 Tax=Syntrophomonas palmitatica TaxID=402877 RepID=UPI0006D0DD9A|nr:protease inhibitor I42 family protein [Syntrophomonas palmitatica]
MKKIGIGFLIALFALVNPVLALAASGNDYPEGGKMLPRYVKAAEVDKPVNVKTIISEAYNNKELNVAVGDTFKISLASNPSTGYEWMLRDWDKTRLVLVNKGFVNPNSSPQIVGQAGRSCWTFKALKNGRVQLKMTYARPWESVQPLKKYQVTVNIGPARSDAVVKVTTREYNHKIKYKSVDLDIPVLSGLSNQTVQKRINKLLENDAMTWKAGVEDDFNDYVKECQMAGFPVRPYEMVSKYTVCTKNSAFLSLYVDYYQYTGGAHGQTDRRAYNIDLKTGQVLDLRSLFVTNYDYKTVINKEIRKEIAKDPDNYFTGKEGFKGITKQQRFYIQDRKLIVYFNQYEIAPYAAGIPEFKIPLSTFKGNYRIQ